MVKKYLDIRRTPGFNACYSRIRTSLRSGSLNAYLELPGGMDIILDAIELSRRCWPVKRIKMAGEEHLFHLAVVDIGSRSLHVRYYVDDDDIAHLMAAWLDGNDTPLYILP